MAIFVNIFFVNGDDYITVILTVAHNSHTLTIKKKGSHTNKVILFTNQKNTITNKKGTLTTKKKRLQTKKQKMPR